MRTGEEARAKVLRGVVTHIVGPSQERERRLGLVTIVRNLVILRSIVSSSREQKRQETHGDRDDKNTAATVFKSDDEVTLICATCECHHVDGSDLEWLVDTRASYHYVLIRDYFQSYKAGDFGSVKMGNQSSATIVGIGDIQVKTSIGCMLTLKDVRHIHD